ncbi:Translation initiation factor IF-2 [Bienertia sinuspersici]
MYQDEIPNRPVGYGLGVKKGNIYGVRGVLRKEGYGKIQRNIVMQSFKEEVATLHIKNNKLEKEKEKLKDQVHENKFLFKTLIGQFSQNSVSTPCHSKPLPTPAHANLAPANPFSPLTLPLPTPAPAPDSPYPLASPTPATPSPCQPPATPSPCQPLTLPLPNPAPATPSPYQHPATLSSCQPPANPCPSPDSPRPLALPAPAQCNNA